MAEQNGAQPRHPAGQYPSPQSYPSPQMPPAYAYPPPQGQANEAYRHSPTAANAVLPPVNLPPLRSIDGQAPPPQLMAQPGNSHLGQTMPPMTSYYPPPPTMPHPGQALPQYARYAPIPHGAASTGGRQKKEIKRRTKTGCLTCRKRRIKCDEQHPICRNCQKSKRECLGYDPIFKQQSGNLLPAPPPATSSPASASPTPASTVSSIPGPYSPESKYLPPHSAPYPSTQKNLPPIPHPTPPIHEAIDPALAGSPKLDRKPFEGIHSPTAPALKMEEAKGKPARQMGLEELFYVNQYGPYDLPRNPEPLSDEQIQAVRDLYLRDFAPGLDLFLETEWFSTTGLGRLLATSSLVHELAELARHFAGINAQYPGEGESRCRATESRAVWQLLNLCRSTGAGNGIEQIDIETPEGRAEIVECLITHRILDDRRLKAPLSAQEGWSNHQADGNPFWAALANFVTRRSDDPSTGSDVCLMQCRNSLQARENRDVLYSIMITHHMGWRVPGFPENVLPEHGGEQSYVNKVFIARQFIQDQASYKGTNQIVQRICDMVVRSWEIGW